MVYLINEETLGGIKSLRASSPEKLDWSSVFVLPEWLEVWWQSFGVGTGMRPWLLKVQKDGEILGLAPLMAAPGAVQFLGNTDVCDYMDFVLCPGQETEFFEALLDYLAGGGIRQLDLKHVRQDSTVLNILAPLADKRGLGVEIRQESVSLEMALPASFDGYLDSLSSKQRHEVRRKLRRLHEEGSVSYRFVGGGEPLPPALDTFFRMFVESRSDKANFLTAEMEAFFRAMASAMNRAGLFRLGVLELDGQPLAEIICFDYQGCVYLYNSGYDPRYASLSAGLISKVMAIEESIRLGKKKFDFLKGAEAYKYHLGGHEVPLYRCRITL
ncbi:MAG: GNAT family N-acetyltransferase [Dehalococcoidales bacterium]|nr:GNAT family N-acetyltransferase [Dehalococcoidales bacterium]